VTAPCANIVLAVAPSNNDTDILETAKYAVDNNVGDVISQSFGEATCDVAVAGIAAGGHIVAG
jgi:hypothetical protein